MLTVVNDVRVNAMEYLMEEPMQCFILEKAIGYIDMSLGIIFGVQIR